MSKGINNAVRSFLGWSAREGGLPRPEAFSWFDLGISGRAYATANEAVEAFRGRLTAVEAEDNGVFGVKFSAVPVEGGEGGWVIIDAAVADTISPYAR